MSITIISTHSAAHIAKKIAKHQDFQVLFNELNKDGKSSFPDGEQYVRLPQTEKLSGRVIILHSGMPNPDSGLRELEMILDLLNNNPRIIIEIFFLYFPYCMQDKKNQEGEINATEKLLHKYTMYYGVKKIYAIDPHFADREWVSGYPFIAISALNNSIGASSRDYPNIMYVAPDDGSQRRTKFKGVSKKRTDSFTIEILHDEDFACSVDGKVVGVVDDLVETGTTMIQFYDKCRSYGAKHLIAVITHGVLSAGISRIKGKYEQLYLTNTIDRAEANIDVTDLVVASINP